MSASAKKVRYNVNKTIPVGEDIPCANCGKKVKKTSYQKQFCSNKGRSNCKDDYWNSVDVYRRARAMAHNEVYLNDDEDDGLGFHPFESGYFGHGQE